MTVSAEMICGNLNSRLSSLVEGEIDKALSEIKPMVDEMDSQLAAIGDATTSQAEDIDAAVNQKSKDVEEMLEATSESDSLTPDAKTILECLGTPVKPYLDISSFAKDIEMLLDGAVSGLVDTAQRQVAGLIEAAAKKIPTKSIDKALKLAQCLADCPGGASYSVLDIENRLADAGITASGEIDMESLSGSTSVKDATKALADVKRTNKQALSKKLLTG